MSAVVEPARLSELQRARLAELEAVVERGLQTFVEVGLALTEIRERGLYRETHAAFEGYCRERWGFSGSRGRQMIAAAKTVTAVTDLGLPAPENESQTRALAPLVNLCRDHPERQDDILRDVEKRARATAPAPTVRFARKDGTPPAGPAPRPWFTPALIRGVAADWRSRLDGRAADAVTRPPPRPVAEAARRLLEVAREVEETNRWIEEGAEARFDEVATERDLGDAWVAHKAQFSQARRLDAEMRRLLGQLADVRDEIERGALTGSRAAGVRVAEAKRERREMEAGQ